MSRKKKARPDAATSRRAGQEKQQTRSNSHHKHTTQGPGGQRKIADLLSYGQENAIPRRHLEKLTGLDGRTVRLMIEGVLSARHRARKGRLRPLHAPQGR